MRVCDICAVSAQPRQSDRLERVVRKADPVMQVYSFNAHCGCIQQIINTPYNAFDGVAEAWDSMTAIY